MSPKFSLGPPGTSPESPRMSKTQHILHGSSFQHVHVGASAMGLEDPSAVLFLLFLEQCWPPNKNSVSVDWTTVKLSKFDHVILLLKTLWWVTTTKGLRPNFLAWHTHSALQAGSNLLLASLPQFPVMLLLLQPHQTISHAPKTMFSVISQDLWWNALPLIKPYLLFVTNSKVGYKHIHHTSLFTYSTCHPMPT